MRGAKLFCKRPSASLPPPTKRNAEERKKFSFAAFARTIGGAKGDCAGCGNPAIRPRPAKFSAPFFESRTDCAATEIYSYKPRANLSKPLTILQVSAAQKGIAPAAKSRNPPASRKTFRALFRISNKLCSGRNLFLQASRKSFKALDNYPSLGGASPGASGHIPRVGSEGQKNSSAPGR